MFKKVTGILYSASRKIGKLSTTLHDADTLMSGDSKKITSRLIRKTISKKSNKIIKDFNKKIR